MIEWITQQPWSDGKVGMVGISAFGGEQFRAAAQGHPALKAIFPYDPMGVYGGMWSFRDFNPGGVVHTMLYYLFPLGTVHEPCGAPPEKLPPGDQERWEWAIKNPDYKMYAHLWGVLSQKGQRNHGMYGILVDPYDDPQNYEEAQARFRQLKIPFYTGSGQYAYSYKLHWQGMQHWFQNVQGVPKKLTINGPAHMERPFWEMHDEILRWYDYWLKGIDTGIMDEPPVKYWVMGENVYRTADDWPIPGTQWTKYYLHSWERLKTDPHIPSDQTQAAEREPDAFVQMPPTKTMKIERLRYMTDPLPKDTLVAGPISLTLYAALDQEDTNWIVVLKDIGPDVSVRTQREGERFVPGRPAGAGADPGLAEGVTSGGGSGTLEAVGALASADARGAAAGGAGSGQRVSDRGPLRSEHVQGRPSHMPGHHLHGHRDRDWGADQHRVRGPACLQQQDRPSQGLSQRRVSVPSAAAHQPRRVSGTSCETCPPLQPPARVRRLRFAGRGLLAVYEDRVAGREQGGS